MNQSFCLMKSSVPKILLCLLFSATFFSCLKQSPDSPPDTTQQNPNLTVNASIEQLKSWPSGVAISGGRIISGVVVMSDKSGNYFKKLVLQDHTGGIEIELNQSYLYADFPVGRNVFVKCDGLFLSKKNGILQLGYLPDANGYVQPIPQPMIKDFLFPGKFPVTIHPDTVSITQLAVPKDAEQYLNTLVVLKDIEFVDSNTSVPYAQPSDISASTTRILRDCSGAQLPLQTSGYAYFQSVNTPSGNGTITALYTRFGDQPLLVIRDTTDIRFYGDRCNHFPPTRSLLTILQLRQLFAGHTGTITLGNIQISGVVISDKNYKNTPAPSFVLQGGTNDAGIMIQSNQSPNFNIGDSVLISLNGGQLKNDYGSLSVKNISRSAIQVVGSHKIIEPKAATISQIKANPVSFDSRLVTIRNIHWLQFPTTFNGQSGNLNFSDGTDSMSHFCEQTATFKADPVTQNAALSITGYIFIQNNQVFLKMRNPDAPEDDLKE